MSLEPLKIYLMIMKAQYEDKALAGFYNVGPDDRDCITLGQLVDLFCEKWNENEQNGNCVKWVNKAEANAPARRLTFSNWIALRLRECLDGNPRWGE